MLRGLSVVNMLRVFWFEHVEGFSQVHDNLTHLDLSHCRRVHCTRFHDDLDTRIITSMITKAHQLDCHDALADGRTLERTEAPTDGSPL